MLFSKEKGKIKGIAKGVRKLRSRLAGSVGLLNQAELQCYGKTHQDLFLITQGQLVTSYPAIKSNLSLLGQAARFYELVDRLTPDHQPLPEIFLLLSEAMQLLESGYAPIVTGIWFEMTLLDYMGYGPLLGKCMTCDQVKDRVAYVPEKGGIVCAACGSTSLLFLSRGARALLEKLRCSKSDTVKTIKLERKMEKEITLFLNAALRYQVGRGLNSDKFRQAVSRINI